jgi:hypothetical protein
MDMRCLSWVHCPPLSLLPPLEQGAQQQLQRIELLVKIQQYDNARMQLREGSFKSLRSDLRYEAEYRGVEPEVRQPLASWVSQPLCAVSRVQRGGRSDARTALIDCHQGPTWCAAHTHTTILWLAVTPACPHHASANSSTIRLLPGYSGTACC